MESIPQNGASVLVVDDDEGLLLSIRATLMSAGLPEPALLSDSRRVLDLLRRFRFTLVLQDLIMPHISGMEVLQRIKEEFPSVECIVVTAVDDVASAVQA
ncbi:MAG TPA: response regulator, partial [Syntrophales bacterium]|nr:response regulator [Syntrophales bacterium]